MTQSSFYPRFFGVVSLVALGYALFRIFEPFFSPILWAVLLAFLLHPVNTRLRPRLRGSPGAAAGLLTLVVMLGLAVPATLLAIVFAGQASDLAARASAAATRYQIVGPSDVFRIPLLQDALRWIEGRVPMTAPQIQDWILGSIKRVLGHLAASGGAIFVGALGMFASLILMLFLLFFFLRDGDAIALRLVRIVPMADERKGRLVEHLAAVTKAVVFGILVTAMVQGVLVGIAFGLVGLPSPVVFGAVAAACSLLPIGGTAFVWGPGAIALAVQGRWGAATFLVAWGAILVSTIDNLLRPLFISGRAQISTLPVFFGVLGGLAAFGPIGMFLGPVLVALALALMRFVEESQERETGSPSADQ